MEQLSSDVGNQHDEDYAKLLAGVQTRFLTRVADGMPLFQTDALDLWRVYLDSFTDPTERQHHNCHACRQFIENFGGLVTIDAAGLTVSAIWHIDDASDAYRPAWAALAKAVRRAKVTGVFLASTPTWGTPETGIWRHLAVTPPAAMLHKCVTQTAGQAMAEKHEDFKTVMLALHEFSLPHIATALTLLKTDALYRSEKVLGQAQWLHDLYTACSTAHDSNRANVVWRAVATAPAGFCHPRSSVIGTLLEDIAAGKPFDEVSRAFAAKMHPLQYQRPQTAPTTGQIDAAEKLVAQLQAAGALARRFCRLDEIEALWRPTPPPDAPRAGVFGHLRQPATVTPSSLNIPAQTMTWEKFQRTVLPTAERIEFCAPAHGSYTALVTAVNADAPPILQWDQSDKRNPVSWYFWNGGSSAAQFGLRPNEFVTVEAVAFKPSMWHGGYEHQGAGILFVLVGARESQQAGAAIFPEILKAEFHGIRAVIEAHSRSASIAGMQDPHVAGVMLKKGSSWNALLRVYSAGAWLTYRLDRWD